MVAIALKNFINVETRHFDCSSQYKREIVGNHYYNLFCAHIRLNIIYSIISIIYLFKYLSQ